MRKTILYIILLLMFIFPNMAKAETITLDICEDGCEYASIEEAAMYMFSVEGTNHEVIINLHGGTHELGYVPFEFRDKISKLTFNGNNATINVDEYVSVMYIDTVEIKDITFNTGERYVINAKKILLNNVNLNIESEINIYGSNIDLNNCNITAPEISVVGIDFESINNEIVNSRSYLNNVSSIKNSTFSGLLLNLGNTITFDNSTINNGVLCAMADCYFENSNIKGGIISGYMFPGANIHVKEGNTLKQPLTRQVIHTNDDGDGLIDIMGEDGTLNEVVFMDQGNQEISRDLKNNVFYYQVINKTIKEETNISDFESLFVNTYENSEDYDEIKDLPITWKSENESVATIKDGKIIPGNAGKADLTGTRGNDIYTIHLTVEKETLPEKIGNLIEKKTIKVPITGKEVKLWIVIVASILLIVIGCSILLIIKKRKKKTTK